MPRAVDPRRSTGLLAATESSRCHKTRHAESCLTRIGYGMTNRGSASLLGMHAGARNMSSRHAWAGRPGLAFSEPQATLMADSACTSSDVYRAVEERLGRLSTAPSVMCC